jgi:hypothetical protein
MSPGTGYDEQPLTLPAARGGVLSRPAGDSPSRSLAVVLFNAGYIHRMGPFRLHVALARRLAQQGITCLRLDQPGVGDALAAADRPLPELMRENLDALQAATGIEQFVVGGICSAADLGWRLALEDSRVRGLLLLDPLARRGAPGFRLGQLRLLASRGPLALLQLIVRRLRRATAAAPNVIGPDDADLRDWPKPGEEAAQLAALVEREVELFMLYTGGAARYMTHLRQVRAAFGAAVDSPRVWLRHWRDCDHLFFRPQHRERLIEAACDWVEARLEAGT